MEATIEAVSHTVETKDPYVAAHQKRVSQLACTIAKEMGLTAWQIDGIRVVGMLHDIGKITVPTEILSKPGKLSKIEVSMIKDHPKVAFDILKNIEFDWPIARIVVQHHERMDGSGYPYGILGKDILLEARILAVADVVEAMSSDRPYRAARGVEEALAELATWLWNSLRLRRRGCLQEGDQRARLQDRAQHLSIVDTASGLSQDCAYFVNGNTFSRT